MCPRKRVYLEDCGWSMAYDSLRAIAAAYSQEPDDTVYDDVGEMQAEMPAEYASSLRKLAKIKRAIGKDRWERRDFRGVDFSGIAWCTLRITDWSGDFSGCIFDRGDWIGINLSGYDFTKTCIADASFRYSRFLGVCVFQAKIRRDFFNTCTFKKCRVDEEFRKIVGGNGGDYYASF